MPNLFASIATINVQTYAARRRRYESFFNYEDSKRASLDFEGAKALLAIEPSFVAQIETGLVLSCNDAFADLICRSTQDVIGDRLIHFIPEDQDDKLFAGLEDLRRTGGFNIEIPCLSVGGRPIRTWLTGHAIRTRGARLIVIRANRMAACPLEAPRFFFV